MENYKKEKSFWNFNNAFKIALLLIGIAFIIIFSIIASALVVPTSSNEQFQTFEFHDDYVDVQLDVDWEHHTYKYDVESEYEGNYYYYYDNYTYDVASKLDIDSFFDEPNWIFESSFNLTSISITYYIDFNSDGLYQEGEEQNTSFEINWVYQVVTFEGDVIEAS